VTTDSLTSLITWTKEQEWEMSKCFSSSISGSITDMSQKHAMLFTRTHQSLMSQLIASYPEDADGNETTKQATVTFVYCQNAQYLYGHECDHRNTRK
jgi:hypothetical protein